MKFWDASAIVPLLVEESDSELVGDLLKEDPGMVVWWATRSECISALAKKRRDGLIPPLQQARA